MAGETGAGPDSPTPTHGARTLLLLLGLSLVGLATVSLFVPERQALIGDERYYYASGEAVLSGHPSRRGETVVNDRNIMPLTAVYPLTSLALREVFGVPPLEDFTPSANAVFYAKLATAVLSLALALVVFGFGRDLYGVPAGLLAMALYVFDPNVIAHSRVVHQDLLGALFVVVAVFCFWRFLRAPSIRAGVWSVATFALAQVARYTSLYLVPIFLLLLAGRDGAALLRAVRRGGVGEASVPLRRVGAWAVVYGLVTLVVINAGYSFDRTGTRFGEIDLASHTLSTLQARSGVLRELPVPLPLAYVRGLDQVRFKQETGFGSGPSYLLGRVGEVEGRRIGFLSYYVVAFLFKVPIATQVLLVLALVNLVHRRRQASFWDNEAFLLVPCLVYFAVFSLSSCQLGIRYLLMVFPLLYVFAGSLARRWGALPVASRVAVVALVGYLVASNLSYYPHYLSYFNELLVDRRMGYTVLADSNLDWGQSGFYLRRYLDEHPEAMYAPSWRALHRRPDLRLPRHPPWDPDQPVAGLVVVAASDLVGVSDDPERYRWLRERLRPREHVAYSHLVFEVREEDLPELPGALTKSAAGETR